ncbi:MAG: Holliday junction branch migration DNA helicase RuvB [Candidatus Pacebacteria bacterium CG10_big_fil_rev_8_21_14_0_10_56_10]|nr:MAG: Holliday junction branch migration DNA helicase RuvB [Candidatus Pacebacteria bacterium CG10_big_fil_rev_8_21_14_0_10_56_10]
MPSSVGTPPPQPPPDHEDEKLLKSLRVTDWEAFQGQGRVKKSLYILIAAAKKREDAIDHVLLYGPPGLGKTTLSHLIAKQLGVNIRTTSGTALARTGDLAAVLTNLKPKDVLFVDEVHRLPKPVEEMLYSAMEDYVLDIVIGKGPSARTVRLDLQPFTLIGATTRFGLLSGPFRDRFGVTHRVEYYRPRELLTILEQAARQLGVDIDKPAILDIARRARGTPRIALTLLKRVRDFAQIERDSQVSAEVVKEALNLHSVDELGLTAHDRLFLDTIISKHGGGPVGLSTLAATLNEDTITIEEVVEPYLLQVSLIKKTPQGRVATPAAYQHLGLKPAS